MQNFIGHTYRNVLYVTLNNCQPEFVTQVQIVHGRMPLWQKAASRFRNSQGPGDIAHRSQCLTAEDWKLAGIARTRGTPPTAADHSAILPVHVHQWLYICSWIAPARQNS